MTAVAIISINSESIGEAEEDELAGKAILTAKAMLGRYIYGLDKKRFVLSGVYVDFTCLLSPSTIVAQVSK